MPRLIETLGKEKNVIFSFFTPPYHLLNVQKSKNSATPLSLAYENTDLAQEYAAQAIFGGIGFKGKLPVTLKGLYAFGTGFEYRGQPVWGLYRPRRGWV